MTQPFSMRKKVPVKKTDRTAPAEAEAIGGKPTPVILPAGNRPPLRPGKVVMTTQEKLTLAGLGYCEGDAIPGDLAEQIAAARRDQAADYRQAIDETVEHGKTVAPKEPVDINSLPPAKRQQLREILKKANQDMARLEALAEEKGMISQLSPGIQHAAAMAAEPVEVIRSKNPIDPTKPASDRPAAAKPAGFAPAANPLQPTPADEMPEVAAAADAPIATGAEALQRCQHCNWPLEQPEAANPTQDDLVDFATSILGGQPFLKEMAFFGKSLRFTYRSLSVTLAEMALTQISIDRRNGKINNLDDFYRLLWDYRLVGSIHRVVFNTETYNIGAEVDSIVAEPSLAEVEADDTVLPFLLKKLLEVPAINNESVWRLLGQNAKRFSNLVEALEARADDPSFWTAIEN